MFLLSHCCQRPFPHGGSRSSSPPRGALQHCAGLWTRCGGSSDWNLVLLLCVLASNVHSCRNSCIFFRRRSQCPSTDTVCLVGRVDLVFSLYNWCEGFGSCSLATLPLGFNCGFISTSACGLSTGACSWGRPGEPGSAPGVEVGQLLEWPGFWQHSTQGSWRLGRQELECSTRVMATRINQYPPASLPGEPHCQRRLAGHSTQGCKELDMTEATLA